jgi:hypothetical protein
MKRLAWFTGLAWALTLTQTTYAVSRPSGALTVTGDIRTSAVPADTADSNPFIIVGHATSSSESDVTVAGSASSPKTSVVTPKVSTRPVAATAVRPVVATAASSKSAGTPSQADTKPTPGVPTLLSSISPVLTSLVIRSGGFSNTPRGRGYEPAPVNNTGPGTPAGLHPFNPTPTSPGTTPHASVPDGGTTSFLLGIGFLGTAMMKKKFAK